MLLFSVLFCFFWERPMKEMLNNENVVSKKSHRYISNPLVHKTTTICVAEQQ